MLVKIVITSYLDAFWKETVIGPRRGGKLGVTYIFYVLVCVFKRAYIAPSPSLSMNWSGCHFGKSACE